MSAYEAKCDPAKAARMSANDRLCCKSRFASFLCLFASADGIQRNYQKKWWAAGFRTSFERAGRRTPLRPKRAKRPVTRPALP